ncbi:long-chain-fatty-acid--CoA ligase [Desulfocucumis palustris]|uniref:Long-chain-fatty-acid--CoA ligase n=1 Tax=Desulfocucumis palustris TaxID=1898651 RepID=A0A2L2X8B7_9FIRM|nr:long-chain fatty acid--CoA ligase [Desulfocucumis palustris]GBF32348.1 long-chain-fatty-acid--CoA ligase [Desulfocucumis palustris]
MDNSALPTICQGFYSTAEKYSNRRAQLFNNELYKDNNGCFTYGEMLERVESIARGLLSLGLEKQERAAIMAANSPYWTQADLAVINCGCVTVTIYPTLSLNEASYIINDSGCRYLFAGNGDILARILPGLGDMPTLEKIIVLEMGYKGDGEKIMGLGELAELGRKGAESLHRQYTGRRLGVSLEHWASIIYTSGTTGTGKGVILTHRSFSSRVMGVLENFPQMGVSITREDVCLSFLPLSHIFDRGSGQMLAIFTGACIAYGDKPSTILQDLQKYNPTWFNCVPRLYERIYITIREQMSQNPVKKFIFNRALAVGRKVLEYRTDDHGRINMAHDFNVAEKLPPLLRFRYALADRVFARVRALFGSRFKQSFSAGAGISAELATFFYIMGVRVLEGYGLTETCNACNLTPLNGIKPGKVGPVVAGSTARLGEDGEYITGGAGLFAGYLNKPEETAGAFTPDGWFKTGDVGEIDRDGYLKIVDRKKAIIVLNTGKNVAPAKIEKLFATSSCVEQAFVVGDDRKYIGVLLVPNFNYFIELYQRENISFDKSKLVYSNIAGAEICVQVGEDFVSRGILREMLDKEVARVNRRLEEYETVKKYAVITRRFTEETGELTPTLKPKKRVILANYNDVVEGLYK